MKINCPKCKVAYELPDKALPKDRPDAKPRKLKCFKCKTVFTISRKEPERRSDYEEFADPAAHADQETRDEQTQDEERLCLEVFNAATDDENGASPGTPAGSLVTRTSAWNHGDTLDLSSFAMQSRRSFVWFATVILAFAIVVAAAFFTFVAWRNDWTISFPQLGDQISNAFFGEEEAVLPTPEELVGLTAILEKGYKLISLEDNRHIVVVTGTVTNADNRARTNVMLEARIVNYKGKTQKKKLAPCGWMVKDKRLKKLPLGDADKIYKRKDKFFNCVIGANGTKKYKIFFDELPEGYNDSFSIQVKPVSATIKETASAPEPKTL